MAHAMTDPHHSPYKSTGGLRRVLRAWRYSLQGLGAALKHEAAFRQELALVVVLAPAAIWLGRDATEVLLLLFSMLLVLVTELLNSAIEALADALSVETHPLLGRAKDLGSAAVMLTLLFSAGLWLHVLIGRFQGNA
ncbi:diacylglycerol kinase [Pigmentiphaga humi]